MEKIMITIIKDEKSGKLLNAWKTEGYSRDSISDILEIVGLVDNFKNNILLDKIKILMNKNFKGNNGEKNGKKDE
jgi:hypothetical protein